jgi:gluconolactonase
VKYEIVTSDAAFGEGPVWCPDGTLVITHVSPGGLRRIWPDSGRSQMIADTGGGANGAKLASDGGFIVTQNGGIDFKPFAQLLGLDPQKVPTLRPAAPGLQRVSPSGQVSYLARAGLQGPNDLTIAADGTAYFTDPPHLEGGAPPEPGAPGKGRLWSYAGTGEPRRIADGLSYPNGIALSPDRRLLVVEGAGLLWVDPASGARDWLVEQLPRGQGDGFCFDAQGRIYVATPLGRGITVLERDGRVADFWDAGGVVTNVCFGGPDNRTLFTTELAPGRVLAFEGLPSPGLALQPWAAPRA